MQIDARRLDHGCVRIGEEDRQVGGQGRLIVLDFHQIIAASRQDGVGQVLLGQERIDRHD